MQWLRARSSPKGGASKQGTTKVALDVMASHGVKLTPATEAALERELSASESGNLFAQCVNSRLVFRLYLNIDPSSEDDAWWKLQYASLISLDEGTGIDVPSLKVYRDNFKVSASGVQRFTLERALRSQQDWAEGVRASCVGAPS